MIDLFSWNLFVISLYLFFFLSGFRVGTILYPPYSSSSTPVTTYLPHLSPYYNYHIYNTNIIILPSDSPEFFESTPDFIDVSVNDYDVVDSASQDPR